MALFVFQASVVKRSKGQSVIARAAYNSRTNMNDERTGERHGRWSPEVREAEVEFSEIFAPKNAPAWARNRAALWNEVEAREDRPSAGLNPATAQLARDFKIAIPHELNKQQRAWLVTNFSRELMRKGMVVDVNIHIPEEGKDERNYHVHMLLTMREIGPDGFDKKNRDWNKKEFLEGLRERWAELGARQLDRAGFHLEAERYKVSHLTLGKQKEKAEQRRDWAWAKELDREPTIHEGPHVRAMENKKNVRTRKGDLNHEIKNRNRARLGLSPLRRTGAIPKTFRRAAGKVLDSVADGLTSWAAPILTEEQKAAGREADAAKAARAAHAEQQRAWDAEKAERDRRNNSRDR